MVFEGGMGCVCRDNGGGRGFLYFDEIFQQQLCNTSVGELVNEDSRKPPLQVWSLIAKYTEFSRCSLSTRHGAMLLPHEHSIYKPSGLAKVSDSSAVFLIVTLRAA